MSSPGATCPVCTASRRLVVLMILSLSLLSLFPGDVHQGDGQAARMVWGGPGSVSRCHEPPIVIVIKIFGLSSRACDDYKVTQLPINTVTIAASCWRQGGQPGRLDPVGGRNKVGPDRGTSRNKGVMSASCRVQVRPRPLGCGEPGLECWSVSGLRPRRVCRYILVSPLETDRLPI